MWIRAVILSAYILLALVEEAHLAEKFGDAYSAYRRKTGFLLPFVVVGRRWLDIALSVLVPVALLAGLVWLNRWLFP